jgi:hypothetical protein
VPSSSPHRDLRSLVQAFRQQPQAFAWGGGSAGGTDHILAGLLAEAAAVDPRRVNYIAFSGGGEAVAALLGGHVAAGISGYSEFAAHIASGRLRALAVSAPSRVPGIDVPTMREAGLDVELVNWRAVMAPAGISSDDRTRLTSIVHQAIRSPRWRRILTEREWTDLYLDGEAFDAYLEAERTRFRRIVARLRGTAPTSAGQRIVPTAVLGGGLVVLIAVILKRFRSARSVDRAADQQGLKGPPDIEQQPSNDDVRVNRAGLGLICCACVTFVALLPVFGFVVAATTLFALTAFAFRSGTTRPRFDGRDAARLVTIAAVFSTVVFFAFTRGLDLPLPSGSLWTWMR